MFIPIGTIVAYAGNTDPSIYTGWYLCNGQKWDVHRFNTLSELLGNTHGPVTDGNFCLPNYQGYSLRGATRADRPGIRQDSEVGPHDHQIKGVHLEAESGTGCHGSERKKS
ncbi:MAG: tail fiber protein [Candidatus Obscuribacter sp.]|jgi:microcystin-dependent protein|nr:tail fiber protein [Candidatus Obscuribacter sp.]MBP6350080.1 tail fiber protein [Candidatus Obscuribacter sp.]MBP6594462.1 tail fiber protein [Candidatus Obscuribacter sp.]MBP7577725.1 tail fiber protein [Candidatus Obscuribacter sp.]